MGALSVEDACGFACQFEKLLELSEEPMRQFFLNKYMLAVGVVFVLQFHLLMLWPDCDSIKYGGHSGVPFVRVLGRNLVILNIYYYTDLAEHAVGTNPFVFSMVFVVLDTVVIWYPIHRLALRLYPHRQVTNHEEQANGNEEDNIIKTRYSDFSFPIAHVFSMFFAQFCLFIMFVLEVNADDETHNTESVLLYQWLVGVAITHVAGSDEVGTTFDMEIWNVIKKYSCVSPRVEDQRSPGVSPRVEDQRPVECHVRMFFDFVINAFVREALLGVAPVLLAVTGRMDFIKDCLAIFFIARMDDIDDAKTLRECFDKKATGTKDGAKTSKNSLSVTADEKGPLLEDP